MFNKSFSQIIIEPVGSMTLHTSIRKLVRHGIYYEVTDETELKQSYKHGNQIIIIN